MDLNYLKQYASVVVRRGLFLKEGQPLYIEAYAEHEKLVCAIAEAAYDAGAANVTVKFKSAELDRIKLLRGGDKLSEVNEADLAATDYHGGAKSAFLRIDNVDLEVFKDVPAQNIQRKALADGQLRKRFSAKAGMSQSCIICCPTPSWAKAVYPNLAPEEALEKLWDAVFECTRAKQPDPLKAWDDYIANSRRRRKMLTDKHYITFHYKSEKTDLYLSPTDMQYWGGGCVDFPDSDEIFVPNVPTEEIFTTPHKYKAQGHVSSSRPLNYRGQIIDNFTLYLKDGKVVDYKAEKGGEVLKGILETDGGSCYFGEMAFVDKTSPISALNTTFFTTLYDENASCHIALGNAYGGDPEQCEKLGINQSAIHIDFMVGTEDMSITGQTEAGEWEDVFIEGSWAPQFTL